MSREKQIEEMAKDLCDIECKGMKCDTCDGYGCEYRMQAEALYNTGYRKQEWISVAERLPEKEQQCLIFTKIHFVPDHVDDCNYYEGIELSWYHKDIGFTSNNGLYAKFWMPLPEAPKGENNDT